MQGRLSVVIGDACGHGAEGARLVSGLLPEVFRLSSSGTRPWRLLRALNRRVFEALPVDRFVTATAVELDAHAGTVCVANAGHVPVLIRRASGEVALVGRASGPPLGLLKEVNHEAIYPEEQHPLHPGDVLVFMTDGILEALESDLVGMGRLKELLASAPLGSHAVQARVLEELRRDGAHPHLDDQTLVSVELVDSNSRLAS